MMVLRSVLYYTIPKIDFLKPLQSVGSFHCTSLLLRKSARLLRHLNGLFDPVPAKVLSQFHLFSTCFFHSLIDQNGQIRYKITKLFLENSDREHERCKLKYELNFPKHHRRFLLSSAAPCMLAHRETLRKFFQTIRIFNFFS